MTIFLVSVLVLLQGNQGPYDNKRSEQHPHLRYNKGSPRSGDEDYIYLYTAQPATDIFISG